MTTYSYECKDCNTSATIVCKISEREKYLSKCKCCQSSNIVQVHLKAPHYGNDYITDKNGKKWNGIQD